MQGQPHATPTAACGPLIRGDLVRQRPLRLQIFDFVRAVGTVPRARVAKDLRISPGTVSTLTAELIAQGVLRESQALADVETGARGRPPVALEVCPEAFVVAGIKLASGEHTGLLVDFAGRQLASVRQAAPPGPRPPAEQIDAIGTMLDRMLQDVGRDRSDLAALGMGVPGFVQNATGRIHWSHVLDVRDVDFAALASRRLQVPVTIDNDANLVALAELWFGEGREKSDFAVVTTEQGVGFGLVIDHRLYRGGSQLGMELGHAKVALDGALCRCGQRGCLEAYLADYAIAREAGAALGLPSEDQPPIPDLIARLQDEASAGNAPARSVFARTQRYLAVGLANVVNIFDPSLLILSGGRMRYDWMDPAALLTEMADFAIHTGQDLPPLVVHEWGDLLWAHGAAALALEMVTVTRIGQAREGVS